MCQILVSGKTALAVHWAHAVADRFGDGQLYVNLRGFHPGASAMTSAEALRGFLDALGVPAERVPAGLDAQAALYRSLLADRRVLVLLDNARDAEQVRPLLPGSPRCLVVITSRNQLSGLVATEGAHPLALDLLSPTEARQLLARRLGDARVAAEPDAVEEITVRCARLPLALAVAAARAATEPQLPLAALARELRTTRGALDAFADEDPLADARAVFSSSYRTLSKPAATLFRLLGLHPGPDLATPAAASLAGVPPAQMRPLLAELIRAHLIAEATPGRFTSHDLLRAYATELTHTLDSDASRRAALHRLLDHYLHAANTGARLLESHRVPINPAPPQPGTVLADLSDPDQALAWFTAEHRVLLAAVELAARTGFDRHTWQLAWTLTTFLQRRGHWHDHAAVQHTALEAAERLADQPALIHARRGLGRAYARLGRYDDAHAQFRGSLDACGELDDTVGQANTHLEIASVFERQGHYRHALHHAQVALDRFRAADQRVGQARALNGIGWCHAKLGAYQHTLTNCEQALTLLQDLGDRHGEATTWDSLGYAHHHLGQRDHATTCYQRALDLLRDLGDRHYEAATLTHLGDTQHAAGDLDAARTAWHHALTILDQLGHPDADQIRVKLRDV
jgi:tetratricopeptide (TPR) repeat protein